MSGGLLVKLRLISLMAAMLALVGCSRVAQLTAPQKHPHTARTSTALEADALFWQTLHGGQYDQISPALEALTVAYLQDPRDAVTAAHVGWLHVWRVSEAARSPVKHATITDDLVLSRKYFEEAVQLDPGEARYRGFYGSLLMAEGTVHGEEALVRKGYYTLMGAVNAWPEFNLFTAGYVMSRLPAGSARYRQGLAMQWRTLDLCAGQPVSRMDPDFGAFMHRETQEGHQRVCWNSWIAPHNFEGFFLNFGDMLVKAGDWQSAQRIYADARLSAAYAQWPYREVLEQRIEHAESNVAKFNASDPAGDPISERIMFNSSIACVACHRN
jgi:uncharacterized protein YceK